MSIYDNIAYGPRIHGIKDKATLDQIVEESLRGAAIFDEVKDRLKNQHWGFPATAAASLYCKSTGRTAGRASDG